MGTILDDGEDPGDAAAAWLKANPDALDPWLDGVTTRDGGDALAAVRDARSAPDVDSGGRGTMDWEQRKIPIGDWAETVVDWLTDHGAWFFDGLVRRGHRDHRRDPLVLQTPPPLVVVAVFAALAWFLQRSWWTVALVVARFPLHHEPGLLGGDDRDADPGALGGDRLHGHRGADRHLCGPPPRSSIPRCGRCST